MILLHDVALLFLYLLMTAHRKIGEVERAKQYQEQFEKSVERLLSVDPLHVKVQGLRKTISAHRMRGNTALFKEKNYVEAVRHFKLALEEKPKTLKEISKQLNISKERVRQIEVISLKKLKKNILEISNETKDFFIN